MKEKEQDQRIRQVFGADAEIRESIPGRVEIHVDGGMIGSGRTLARALADALAYQVPGVRRADRMEVRL
jgi:hypothetical protein